MIQAVAEDVVRLSSYLSSPKMTSFSLCISFVKDFCRRKPEERVESCILQSDPNSGINLYSFRDLFFSRGFSYFVKTVCQSFLKFCFTRDAEKKEENEVSHPLNIYLCHKGSVDSLLLW